MTGTLLASARRRPASPLRRALGHELRRSWDLLALYGTFVVVALQCANLLDLRLGFVLILLAVRLPADLADRAPEDGRQLRAALGISRADAVRARTVLTCAGQLLLVLGTAGGILLSDWAPGEAHWSSIDSGGTSLVTLRDHLVDIGLFSGAIAWTHALSGGAAFRLGARPSGRRAAALYLGVCLPIGFVLWGSALLTSTLLLSAGVDDGQGTRFVIAEGVAQATALLLSLGGGVTALVLRSRRWVRRA